MILLFLRPSSKAGVKHIILAVSYRAEMLEKEMKQQETRVSYKYVKCNHVLFSTKSSYY